MIRPRVQSLFLDLSRAFGLLVLVTFAVLSCRIHFSVGNRSDTGTVGDENARVSFETDFVD